MRPRLFPVLVLIALVPFLLTAVSFAGGPATRPCPPERPIPPESVGSIPVPFDVPIWPTLLKTEFNILPWVSFGKASICIPGTCTAVELPAPCFSLKPIPIWIPWLRPLDVECYDRSICISP